MFSVLWLKGQSPIQKETSALTHLQEVIASAEHRAAEVAARHPGNEPDGFRIFDSEGKEVTCHHMG
jgi:hypothetical protein